MSKSAQMLDQSRTGKPSSFSDDRERMLARMNTLIQRDARVAMQEAYRSLDFGVELLLKLIKSEKLIEKYPTDDDAAESCLCSRIDWLIDELCILLKSGRHRAVFTAWSAGTKTATAIHDLALTNPNYLRLVAQDRLYMPSLRARAKHFTYDFGKISESIQLSHNAIIQMGAETRYHLDSDATRFVISLIEFIADLQRNVKRDEETLQSLRSLAETGHAANATEKLPSGLLASNRTHFKKFAGMSLETYLFHKFPANRVPELMACKDLPPFTRENVEVWWQKTIEPRLRKKETVERLRGTAFYNKLERAAMKSKGTSKHYAIVDELRKRCHQVLKSKSLYKAK